MDVKQGMGDGVRTLRLTVQYDGSDFAGYQLQSRARTVQGVLHEAFQRLTGEDVRANAAGRTDTGVHALGQVVSVQTRTALAPQVVGRALNALLPADVAVSDTVDAPPGFHARYSALAREYRYVVYNGPTTGPLWRRYSYHVGDPLDATRMDAALSPLVGRHDFGSFGRGMEDRISGVRGSTVRHMMRARCRRVRAFLIFSFTANAFLRTMIRSLVGTVLLVGRGQLAPEALTAILAARDRGAAGPSAPPHGLVLVRVRY